MGEADLVVRFATSEPGSVDEMYREYGRLVYAVTKRVLGDAALAEEATRQTFVRAWRLAAGLDPSEALEPWLAGIAASTARDIHEHTRAHDSAATATPDEPGPTGPTPAAERENVVSLVRRSCGWSGAPLTRCRPKTVSSSACSTIDSSLSGRVHHLPLVLPDRIS
jgi:DNA-directed RNA polymerase specialized sigma24 family protein